MSQLYEIEDRVEAEAFLAGFPRRIMLRGLELWHRRAVFEIQEIFRGTEYRARVKGSRLYTVMVTLDADLGWDTFCDCPYEDGPCKHGYAAMIALLRGGSGSTAPGPPSKSDVPVKSVLATRFAEAKGRAPNAAEKKFLQKIARLFLDHRESKSPITSDALSRLGVQSGSARFWGALELWPEFPADDHEFWLWIARYAKENKGRYPQYMERVSDPSPLAERVKAWERRKEVARLQHLFEQAELPPDPAEGDSTSELRLRIKPTQVTPEIRRAGAREFRVCTSNLVYEVQRGAVVFEPKSDAIWHQLLVWYHQQGSLRLNLNSPSVSSLLWRFLHHADVRERMVDQTGAPLGWSDERLAWRVSQLPGDDDYRLELVHADGALAGRPQLAVSGWPAYFVIDGVVHAGPPFDMAAQDLSGPQAIPREVIESDAGIGFVRRIGAKLPASLEKRLRVTELRPVVSAKLDPRDGHCVFGIHAEDGDGRRVENCEQGRWVPVGRAKPESDADTEVLETVDRRLLTDPTRWLPEQCQSDWRGHLFMRVTRKFPEQFNEWLASLPDHVAVDLAGELASLKDPRVSGAIGLNVEESGVDWFDLSVELKLDDEDLTDEEVRLLLQANGKLVRLEGKGWRRLEFELSEEEDEQLARLGLNPRQLSDEPQRLHALQLAAPGAKKLLPAEQAEQVRRRAEELKARVAPAVPAALKAELRPYQSEGFHFLAYLASNRFGGILADDMGLGKTVQTLAWLLWLRAESKGRKSNPALVVCPKSVMDNWRAEAERFAPVLKVAVWRRGEVREMPDRLAEADLHVINYNQLRTVGAALKERDFVAAILDEGQNIKNPTSQTSKAACALRAEHRLVLTGTPIENRLLDLWSLMAFAMPGVLGNRNQFGKLYDGKDDPFARLRLSSRVRPFVIRRTKSQVAQDLPARMEEDLYCEIEGEQRKLYDAELKRARQLLQGVETKAQLDKLRFNFLTSLLRLRQVCCHPRLYKKTSRAKSAKIESLLDTLEPIIDEGGKVLVFSQFVELLEILAETLADRGWPLWQLTGATEDRGRLVDEFQQAAGAGVFLISLKAGGAGLNLTAASYVVLFDPWWNPAVENQAIDRTHRIGQTAKVIAYRLLVKNSIEEKIRSLQRAKSALAEDVLGEEKFTGKLTLKDLHFLLEG